MKREPTRINAVTYKKAISKNWPHQYHEPRAVFRSCIVRHSSKWDSILTSPDRLPRSDKIAGSPSLTVLQGCHNGLGGLASMYYAWCRNRRGRERDNKRDAHRWPQAWCVGQGAGRLLVAALGPRMCYYHPPTRPYCLSSRLSTRFVLGKWKETGAELACRSNGNGNYRLPGLELLVQRRISYRTVANASVGCRVIEGTGWEGAGWSMVGGRGSFKQEQTMTHKRKKKYNSMILHWNIRQPIYYALSTGAQSSYNATLNLASGTSSCTTKVPIP